MHVFKTNEGLTILSNCQPSNYIECFVSFGGGFWYHVNQDLETN